MKTNKKFLLFAALGLAIIVVAGVCLKVSGNYVVTANTSKKKLPVYGVKRDDDSLSISFDCAWGVEYTDGILDALDFYGVKATFFVVQFWAEKYPDYLKKISERGHEIGTHSKTHPKMSKLSEKAIEEELTSSVKAIEEITGKKVTLFRPPFGDYNDRLITVAEKLGLNTVQWNVDSLDWKNLSAEEIAVKSLEVAASICVYTNDHISVETL